MYDTIIIGAGMSGLAAGIRLAMYQERVLILERHSAIGGLNSFYRLRGRDYDVGLHAVTNFQPKGSRQGPLARLLRQLRLALGRSGAGAAGRLVDRLSRREARLQQRLRSAAIPGPPALPAADRRLERLVAQLADYGQLGRPATQCSARQVVGRFLDDPLLVEMLFCPLLFYGGASEGDTDLRTVLAPFSLGLPGGAGAAAGGDSAESLPASRKVPATRRRAEAACGRRADRRPRRPRRRRGAR